MTVKIHGKDYKTVAERVNEFHSGEAYRGWSITTDIHTMEGNDCIIKASILDHESRVRGTGFAHEVRDSTTINKTSHVENCETSAVGRALANIGLAGTEYASADEVATAIGKQQSAEAEKRSADCTRALLANYETVMAIKQGIATDDWAGASEPWFTLPDEDKKALWLAPSKGGPFTTKEREVMQHSDFRKSYYGDSDGQA